MMAARRFTYLHTLQGRFLLALALIGIVPLALVGLSVATLDRRALAEQSAREPTGLALGLSGQIDIYFANMLNDNRVIAALPEIVSMNPVHQATLLKELFHHYPEFSRLSTFDPSGEFLASSHTDRLPSSARRESFQTAVRRGHQGWEVSTGLITGRWRFIINTPIRDVDRRVVGVFGTMVDLVNLSTVMERVQAADRRVFVLDAGGRVLLHPDQVAVQERLDYSWLEVPTGGRLANAGTVRYQLEGEMYIAGYAPVLEMGWTVVVERPEREVLAPAARSWYIALAGLGASGFLALLTAVFLARTLTRPVRELAAAARALASGHPALPLPAIASDKGELGMLVEAFAGMRKAVVEREEALSAEARFLRAQTDVANVALSSLQPETLMPRLLEAIARAQGYANGIFWRGLPEGNEAVIVATFGEETVQFLGRRRDVNDPLSVAARTIRSGQPSFQNHLDASQFDSYHLIRALGTRSLLGLPIIRRTGEVVGAMVFGDTDNPERFTERDVTQGAVLANQVSQALENSELFSQVQRLEIQYRVVMESLNDAVFMIDLEGRITFGNAALERLLGYRVEELHGRPATELYTPEAIPEVLEYRRRAFGGESVSPYLQIEVRHKDGRRIPVEIATAALSQDGQVVGRVIVVRDITERKRAEAEVERRGREAEIVADLARSLNTSLDVNTVLQRMVEGAKELCESERALIALREPGSEVAFFRYQVGSRYPGYKTLRVEPGKGAGGQVLLTGRPLRTDNYLADPRISRDYLDVVHQAEVLAVLVVPIQIAARVEGVLYVINRPSRPFTDRDEAILMQLADHAAIAIQNAHLYQEAHRAYADLARTQAQLIQSQKMEAIGRLAGGVAHDFNNLLTVISGYSEMLLYRIGPGESLRRPAEQIKRSVERAASLTRQLLAFSRRQVLQPKVLDLNVLVADMDKMFRRLIGEDIALVLELDPSLGSVKADPGQLEQVLLNLVINARDAMPQGGQLTVETANVELNEASTHAHVSVRPGLHVRLAVRDTGYGMDAETQSHLFEPFFTTKELGKGTGLGLATVYGIVMQSGGHIAVDSAPGRGATFTIYLPCIEEAVEAVESNKARSSLMCGEGIVLLVEDETEVRELAHEILEMAGYTVLAAGSGKEALEMCERHTGPIHLLLTDVVMSGMSGPAVAERLTSSRPAMKVLYMSGYAGDAVAQHGVLDPDRTLLQKPFTPDALARKVREVIDAHHAGL